MISLDDYRKANGNIDWAAYREAQRKAGEICRVCSKLLLYKTGLCNDCKEMGASRSAVDHDNRLRCPKCRDVFEPSSDDYHLYQEGEQDVTCPNCEHTFTVKVSVSYSYESPALLEEEHEEGGE